MRKQAAFLLVAISVGFGVAGCNQSPSQSPGLTDGEWVWCNAPGTGVLGQYSGEWQVEQAWEKLGLPEATSEYGLPMVPWVLKNEDGTALRNDSDYIRACKAAYAATH